MWPQSGRAQREPDVHRPDGLRCLYALYREFRYFTYYHEFRGPLGYEQACSSGGFPVSGSASTPTSGTTGSGSSGSGTTAASGTANTAAASSPSAGKSAAVAHSSVSIVGVVFALGLSGLALL
jgi:hypothetical protein